MKTTIQIVGLINCFAVKKADVVMLLANSYPTEYEKSGLVLALIEYQMIGRKRIIVTWWDLFYTLSLFVTSKCLSSLV